MHINTWLNRKRIAVLGLFFIVLISIENPFSDLHEIFDQRINLNKARNYTCLEQGIPTSEDVLFIGNPFEDPTHASSLALYYRSQYFLAPRLVVLLDSELDISSPGSYRWFISTSLNQEQIGELREKYALTTVRDCGDLFLLQAQVQP
jgi:hypothetical protein